jgi:glutamine synthetase
MSDQPQVKSSYTRDEVAKTLKDEDIRFLRLWFTDITGMNKNVEVPASQFEKALDGQIMFDGSSIEGFVRIEESDMLLKPDFDTFRVHPWSTRAAARSHGSSATCTTRTARPSRAARATSCA